MNRQALASRIFQIISLDSCRFEHELQSIAYEPQILGLLAQVLSSDLLKQQKQLAASGINKIIVDRINRNFREWPFIWKDFCEQVLLRQDVQIIEWRHLSILERSIELLMDEFEQDLPSTILPVFNDCHFKVKVMILECFIAIDTTYQSKQIVLRQTMEDLFHLSLKYVCLLHDERQFDEDNLLFEETIFEIIKNLIKMLQRCQPQQEHELCQYSVSLTFNRDIFGLVVEELMFDYGKQNYLSLEKEQFRFERTNEVVLLSRENSMVLQNHLNKNKARALEIFTAQIKQEDKKTDFEDFDKSKYLSLMEKITPIVIDFVINAISRKEMNDDNEIVFVSLLNLLVQSSKFYKSRQIFFDAFEPLFYKVCYPLMGVNQDELDQFSGDGSNFIRLHEELVEEIADTIETIQNSASRLLQALVEKVEGNVLSVFDVNIDIIRSILLNQPNEQLIKITEKFDCQFSIETSLTILIVLTQFSAERPQNRQKVKRGLFDLPQTKDLKGISLAKLLILLTYNYDDIYEGRQEDALHFLELTSSLLTQDSSIGACALMFFHQCIDLGFGDIIWDFLLQTVETDFTFKPVQGLYKVVKQKIERLPPAYIEKMIKRVIARLIKEYQDYDCSLSVEKVTGTPALIECLNILEEVSQHTDYLKRNPFLIEALWFAFDLLEFADKIQFQDNLLRILVNLSQIDTILPRSFYSWVHKFPGIVHKDQIFSQPLLETYSQLLRKMHERKTQQFLGNRQDLINLLESLKQCYGLRKKQYNLKHICIFFHYAYLKYYKQLSIDKEFIDKLFLVYEQQKQNLSNQTKASIINLFLVTEARFGNSYPRVIEENNIIIFRDYQANIAARNFQLLVMKNYQEDWIIEFLRYSFRLLHWIRETNLNQNIKRSGYYHPFLVAEEQIDPFSCIAETLDFLKNKLDTRRYDMLIDELSQEIHFGEIKDLLTKRVIHKELRTIVRVIDR